MCAREGGCFSVGVPPLIRRGWRRATFPLRGKAFWSSTAPCLPPGEKVPPQGADEGDEGRSRFGNVTPGAPIRMRRVLVNAAGILPRMAVSHSKEMIIHPTNRRGAPCAPMRVWRPLIRRGCAAPPSPGGGRLFCLRCGPRRSHRRPVRQRQPLRGLRARQRHRAGYTPAAARPRRPDEPGPRRRRASSRR